jgi:hypothetical protein
MSASLDMLPANARSACERLRDGLVARLGQDLIGLWVYGAAIFEDRPARLGDVDTYAIVAQAVGVRHKAAVDAIHATSSRHFNVEWDAWYIGERDARGRRPPHHVFQEAEDHAWALHRAHWLEGRYVLLCGEPPSAFVQPPVWSEIREALRMELSFLEKVLPEARKDPQHAAYVVLNGCRILYSLGTRDVVVSKRAAGRWALQELPVPWHHAIAASTRAYDGLLEPDDPGVLRSGVDPVVDAVRAQFT